MEPLPQHGPGPSFPPPSLAVQNSRHSFSFVFLQSLGSLVTVRRCMLLFAFLIGTTVIYIMKREHLLWLLTTTAGAAPLLEFGQGSNFDYDGLRFDQDRKFHISVFEDLHFGERE